MVLIFVGKSFFRPFIRFKFKHQLHLIWMLLSAPFKASSPANNKNEEDDDDERR